MVCSRQSKDIKGSSLYHFDRGGMPAYKQDGKILTCKKVEVVELVIMKCNPNSMHLHANKKYDRTWHCVKLNYPLSQCQHGKEWRGTKRHTNYGVYLKLTQSKRFIIKFDLVGMVKKKKRPKCTVHLLTLANLDFVPWYSQIFEHLDPLPWDLFCFDISLFVQKTLAPDL